jgi:hypothetical protein
MSKADGPPILFDNSIGPWLLNGCNLETDRVASYINYGKRCGHIGLSV